MAKTYIFLQCILLYVSNIISISVDEKFMSVEIIEGKLDGTTTNLFINNSIEYVIHYAETQTHNPYRIRVWSKNATAEQPILIVINQESTVISWENPLIVSSSKREANIYFKNTSRTLCRHDMDRISKLPLKTYVGKQSRDITDQSDQNYFEEFLVTLTTQKEETVDVHIEALEQTDFFVKENINYTIDVSPSESRYVYYKFPAETEGVVVELASDDDICLAISAQDPFCPVFDLNENIKYQGIYQTMTRKGALTLRKYEFPLGFFLVFIARPDNYECTKKSLSRNEAQLINPHRESRISYFIRKDLSYQEYMSPIIWTLAIIFLFFMFAFALIFLFYKYGSIKDLVKLEDQEEEIQDNPIPRNSADLRSLLEADTLTVKMLSQYPIKAKKRSYNYLWHVLSVSVFYGIPVVQLVSTYQRMVNYTGNLDLCYYNFLCAHPLLGLSDFNHIFSNIGYVLLGVLFIFVVIHRQSTTPVKPGMGIPVHYGIYYAMGTSLIIEGVLSACYHICPSQSNYQFDTSFMYVMAVLSSVKLYQNRHPDINATAYGTFTVLGLIIFLAMIGILHGHFIIWLSFYIAYIFLCIYLSFKIYYLSYILQGFKNVKEQLDASGIAKKTFTPNKKARFTLVLIANIINFAMLILGMCIYSINATDFGTFLLLVLMGNTIFHTIFYVSMKLLHKERLCIEAVVYGVLSLVFWMASAVFFFDTATMWMVSPAASRTWNKGCVLMNFFDNHDIWHLLSAPALYFTFMLLLCLDDDLVQTSQENINVF